MDNSELEYQKFKAKSIKAGLEFKHDYENLSEQHKLRFLREMQEQLKFKTLAELIQSFLNRN